MGEENDGGGGGREAERNRRCCALEASFRFVGGAVVRRPPVGTDVDREPRFGRE